MPDDTAEVADRLAPGRPTGDALWDDWDTPPRVPSAPILHLDGFDGPLDLLLDLVERQHLDLGRISLMALVDQFVAASARLATHVAVERRADWLVMATRLVLLRSQLLFAATPEEAEDAARAAEREVAQWEALRYLRAAAAWLRARPLLGHDVFPRPRRGPDPRAASYMALMEACLTVLRGRDEQPAAAAVYRPPLPDLFRIPDALIRIRALLSEITGAQPLGAFLPRLTDAARGNPTIARSAVASTLVAALELCREAEIELAQAEPFGPIVIQAIGPTVAATEELPGRFMVG